MSDKRLLDRLQAIAQDRCAGADPAHDYLHVLRVAGTAQQLCQAEGGNPMIAVAAALLHELFNHPKDHPDSHLSGDVCAEEAVTVLRQVGCPGDIVEPIRYTIQVHSFSRGIRPTTLEAKILQDADRLDAIGAIGIARCFATCSTMQRPFYHFADPFCEERQPDDKQWGVDHFYRKLLLIPDTLHTATARQMAVGRVALMQAFLARLDEEISGGRVGTHEPDL